MKIVHYSGRRYSSCGRVSGRIQDGIRALEVRPLVMSFTMVLHAQASCIVTSFEEFNEKHFVNVS